MTAKAGDRADRSIVAGQSSRRWAWAIPRISFISGCRRGSGHYSRNAIPVGSQARRMLATVWVGLAAAPLTGKCDLAVHGAEAAMSRGDQPRGLPRWRKKAAVSEERIRCRCQPQPMTHVGRPATGRIRLPCDACLSSDHDRGVNPSLARHHFVDVRRHGNPQRRDHRPAQRCLSRRDASESRKSPSPVTRHRLVLARRLRANRAE